MRKTQMRWVGVMAIVGVLWSAPAWAFCGFYVAKADTTVFNKASSVVMVRDGDKTVLTMSNDFQGEVNEFAMVVPVPTVLQEGQIHVGTQSVLDHLDAYSSPRLVEYFDPDPCRPIERLEDMGMRAFPSAAPSRSSKKEARRLGVTIEAQYTVGEYDILILSAEESAGLSTWLTENGYRLPQGASPILSSYIKQGLRFFVAKVNLKKFDALGFARLRPLQIAFESPRFMLPIRLGTVNAQGAQELFAFFLTRKGRVETTNYRTVALPQGQEIPVYVKEQFPSFYRDLFATQVKRESGRGVFLEYAWDMNWCDPCAADPLSVDELNALGVFWLDDRAVKRGVPGQQRDVFLTRLHVRYDAEHFPEDLMFQETTNRKNVQARYVLRHPWSGEADCEAASAYWRRVAERQEREAQTLATLTGWDIEKIRARLTHPLPDSDSSRETWWKRLWRD